MSWDGLNRRRFPRVSYPCLVKVRETDGGDDLILTHTENVGIGGVCIIIKNNIKKGTIIDLQVDLMDVEDQIKCEGKVVWNVRRKAIEETKPNFYDIGIEFVNITEEDRERLEKIISRLVKQGKTVS